MKKKFKQREKKLLSMGLRPNLAVMVTPELDTIISEYYKYSRKTFKSYGQEQSYGQKAD